MPTPEGEELARQGQRFKETLLDSNLKDEARVAVILRGSAVSLAAAFPGPAKLTLARDLLEFYLRSLEVVQGQREGRLSRVMRETRQSRDEVKSRILIRVKKQQHFEIFDALAFAAELLEGKELQAEIKRVNDKLEAQVGRNLTEETPCPTMA